MKSIMIQNLRSLLDTGEISLKPITILVGENSAGKSTFLRTFPLIKQSLETKTSEPILWYGDYVDFGSFEESISKGSKSNTIKMGFKYEFDEKKIFRPYRSINREPNKIELSFIIELDQKLVKTVSIEYFNQKIEVYYKANGIIGHIRVNGNDLKSEDYIWWSNYKSIVPQIAIRMTKEGKSIRLVQRRYFDNEPSFLQKKLSEIIGESNTKVMFFEYLQENIDIFYSKENFIKRIQLLNRKYRKKNTDRDDEDYDKFDNITNLSSNEQDALNQAHIEDNIFDIFEIINGVLEGSANNMFYLKPIRASADRYYRKVGLQLDNIDSSGQNIPMYIANLSDREKIDLSRFTQNNFNFKIIIDGKSEHLSLSICENGTTINMADSGFGFSQILPIIVLLWKIENKSKFDNSMASYRTFDGDEIMLFIEQPELHLHPRYQALLIDTISKVIKLSKKHEKKIKIIFETHSETLVNRVGYLINKEIVDSEDVNIVIFEKQDRFTKVINSGFDENGFLKHWPIGFFYPGEYNK